MLKPIDKGVFISDVKLENKKGGKSQYSKDIDPNLTASVIVCSDSVSAGKKQDFAGKAIISELKNHLFSNYAYTDYFLIDVSYHFHH